MLLSVTIALVSLATIAVTVYWFLKPNLPPGPWGLPVVGYLPWINPRTPQKTLMELSIKYGPIYGLKMGNIYTVVLSDVHLIRKALSMEEFSGRAPLYVTHGIMKGNGIICTQGPKWKESRKFVASTLRNLGMVKIGPTRDKMEADILAGVEEVLQMLNDTRGQPAEIEHILEHAMGNVIFKLVFGKTWSVDDPVWKILQQLQEEGTRLIGVAGPLNFLPFLRFIPKFRRTMDFLENGIKFTHQIYQNILKDYMKEEQMRDHIMGAYIAERDKKEYFDNVQFNYLMADVFGAGLDTTVTTLRWLLLYMATNPNDQETVREELNAISCGRDLRLDDFQNCPFFEACICETQRIRTVTPLGIPHGTTENTNLSGYSIPKDTMVVPLLWAVHMNPIIHLEPEKFSPRRFLNEEGRLKRLDAFIPFQTGKRVCVGEEYARALLFLFGGFIIKDYTILCEDELLSLDGDVGITLTPPAHKLIFRKYTD